MKKICIAIAVIYVVLMLSGCSANEINVEKIQSLNSNTKSENIESQMPNSDDISVFDADTKIDINNLDYEKLLSMDSNNNILSFALKDLVSFESMETFLLNSSVPSFA